MDPKPDHLLVLKYPFSSHSSLSQRPTFDLDISKGKWGDFNLKLICPVPSLYWVRLVCVSGPPYYQTHWPGGFRYRYCFCPNLCWLKFSRRLQVVPGEAGPDPGTRLCLGCHLPGPGLDRSQFDRVMLSWAPERERSRRGHVTPVPGHV